MSKKVNNPFTSVSLREAAEIVSSIGKYVTCLFQGEMGIGKSALLNISAKKSPHHTPIYLEAQSIDVGDLQMPSFSEDKTTVRFVLNEVLGMHTGKPIILMVDEIGKAPGAVLNALLRLFAERQLGGCKLHPDSIVFATTNLAAEGVGDRIPPHARNRMCQMKIRKPTGMEWVEDYALPNGLHPVVIGAAMEYPTMFESFEDCEDPGNNHYINHPKAQRAAFVTPRSMEKASIILGAGMSDGCLAHALMGVVGEAAAMDLLTLHRLNNDLPTWEAVMAGPETVPTPKGGAAACMMAAKAVMRVTREDMGKWLVFLRRMAPEVQVLFLRSIMRHEEKRQMAATHKGVVDLCREFSILLM